MIAFFTDLTCVEKCRKGEDKGLVERELCARAREVRG